MKKIQFILFSILICLIICDKKTKKDKKPGSKYDSACLMRCMRKIKSPARSTQNCIVSQALLNALKMNPSSVAGVIVTTVTGLQTAFKNCKQYVDNLSSSITNIEKECRQKCKRKNK